MRSNYLFLLLFAVAMMTFSCGEDIDNSECADICETYEEGPFSSVGDCVSLCATCFNPSESTGNLAVCYCNYVEAVLNAGGFAHGHTYAGNPLACAAGLASLELLLYGASPMSPSRSVASSW